MSETQHIESTRDILARARSLIKKEERWCRRHLAMTGDGEIAVNPVDVRAARFCVYGAIDRAQLDLGKKAHAGISACCAIERALLSEHGKRYLSTFNDDPATSHDDILGLFDKAITNLDLMIHDK